jgi:hypothetical protein
MTYIGAASDEKSGKNNFSRRSLIGLWDIANGGFGVPNMAK